MLSFLPINWDIYVGVILSEWVSRLPPQPPDTMETTANNSYHRHHHPCHHHCRILTIYYVLGQPLHFACVLSALEECHSHITKKKMGLGKTAHWCSPASWWTTVCLATRAEREVVLHIPQRIGVKSDCLTILLKNQELVVGFYMTVREWQKEKRKTRGRKKERKADKFTK